MQKSFVLMISLMFLFTSSALFAGVTLRYYNKDSGSKTFNARICGSSTSVTFGGGRTASVTIQGCSKATISTNCGNVDVKDGDSIEIVNGCIKVK